MLGVTAPEKPQVSVTKADVPFERIREIANTMLSAGKARTIEQAIAKAASENPELYREYREAMNSEMAAQQSTRVWAYKRSLDHSRVTDSSSSVVILGRGQPS
jgi:hypothetical protein